MRCLKKLGYPERISLGQFMADLDAWLSYNGEEVKIKITSEGKRVILNQTVE